MKRKISKLLALLMAVAIVFSLAACGKEEETETTTAVGDTTAMGETTAVDETTAMVGETIAEGETTTIEGETTAVGETTTVADVDKVPSTKAEILAAYTAVMNNAKTSAPAYKKIEFQSLPSNKVNITKGSGIVESLLNLAGKFMTTEEDARKDPKTYVKGDNMQGFPIKDASKGCLLTDVSAIKTATCVEQSNGNYKITIVLNDEKNPEHYVEGQTKADSNHGNVFAPLSRSDIDPELGKFPVSWTIKDAVYDLNYYNSTVTLNYIPKTQQISSLDMVTYTKLVMEAKVLGGDSAGSAVLEMYISAYEFNY